MIYASMNPLVSALAIIFTIILVLFILIYLLTNKIYNIAFGNRQDKTFLHFFTHEDYEGLNIEPIEFKSTNDNTLRGNIYFYNSNNNRQQKNVKVLHSILTHLLYTSGPSRIRLRLFVCLNHTILSPNAQP